MMNISEKLWLDAQYIFFSLLVFYWLRLQINMLFPRAPEHEPEKQAFHFIPAWYIKQIERSNF